MAEPRIQYATARDGVRIALAAEGEGIPVIAVPPVPWSNVQAEWPHPGYRRLYDALSGLRWIRYDCRGSGSSDRALARPSEGDFAGEFSLDIDAVADKLGLERFALAGMHMGGVPAIRYAATKGERVSHLILWCSPSRVQEIGTKGGEALRALRANDFDLFTETAAHAMVAGWASGEEARSFAAFMRGAINPDSPYTGFALESSFDETENLARIDCPTLVVHRAEANLPSVDAARHIAARVRDSELVVLEGGSLLPWIGDMDSFVRTLVVFLGGEVSDRSPSKPAEGSGSGLATILFTDIEGSTTLTQRFGDAQAQETVRAHDAIVREAIAARGGREVKHTGDGIMASFPLTSSAVEAAIAIQRSVGAHATGLEGAFRVRVGLNAGEPLIEDEDLFGSAVQLARRVCDAAPAGSIYTTDVVRQLLAGKRFAFEDKGTETLRGFDEPVRVFEVRWEA